MRCNVVQVKIPVWGALSGLDMPGTTRVNVIELLKMRFSCYTRLKACYATVVNYQDINQVINTRTTSFD